MKKKFRQIVVDGQTYLWKFSPGYVATNDAVCPWQCHDIFIAYLLQAKSGSLQIHFLTWEDPVAGGPLRTGLPLDLAEIRSRSQGVNLHTPKEAARIIRLALQTGWKPEQRKALFIIERGVEWLMQGE